MKKGFTLIETIVVVALFSMLVAAVLWIFLVGIRAWSSGTDRANIRQNANLAIERMVREISQASEIIRARSNEVEFEADLDQDGFVETIRFDVDRNNNLQRTEDSIEVVIAPSVQSFGLGYYLELDNENLLSSVTGPSRDDIRVIVILLSLSEGGEVYTLSASAYARNQGLDDA